MADRSLFHHPANINPEYLHCEHCQHWSGDYFNKTYAKVDGETVWIGQCLCDGDDRAPFADAGGPELPIFTQPHNHCAAFALHADAAADLADSQETYHQLDMQLRRQAWA